MITDQGADEIPLPKRVPLRGPNQDSIQQKGEYSTKEQATLEVQQPEASGNKAIEKMRKIAQSIFDQTPGMKGTESIILAGVKERRRQLERAAEKKRDFRQDDFETQYKDSIAAYRATKDQIKGRKGDLDGNQHKYIKREAEYRAVIDELHRKIKYHSTNPLQVVEEKQDDVVSFKKDIDRSDP